MKRQQNSPGVLFWTQSVEPLRPNPKCGTQEESLRLCITTPPKPLWICTLLKPPVSFRNNLHKHRNECLIRVIEFWKWHSFRIRSTINKCWTTAFLLTGNGVTQWLCWAVTVRELKNTIERAVVLWQCDTIEVKNFPKRILNRDGGNWNSHSAGDEFGSRKKGINIQEFGVRK